MRQIQVLVPDDRLESVADALEDEGVDVVRQQVWVDDEEVWLLEFPVPTDAIGHFLDRLAEEGVDVGRYTVITSLESAMTTESERLMERFASDFDPLSTPELRSKARDLSHDPRSFFALITASAVLATAGLLVESPAVVVGSMVIAPIVGPVLTASAGAVTGDREMLAESVWIQAAGLGLAIAGAGAFGLVLRASGFVPATLEVTTIELIAVRVAPGFVTIAIGLASGAAAAFGLATKGPTSVIGVMIAAALIPAAATTGIAVVWNEPRVALGSLLLLLLSMALINVGAYAVLSWLGYRSEGREWRLEQTPRRRRVMILASAVVLVVGLAAVGVGAYQHMAFERTVNEEVEGALAASEYESIDPVAVRVQYAGVGPFASPTSVTVVASRTAGAETPAVAGEIERRVREATSRDVAIRVRFVDYQRSDGGAGENLPRLEPGRPPRAVAGQPPSPEAVGSGSLPEPDSGATGGPAGNRFSPSRPNPRA